MDMYITWKNSFFVRLNIHNIDWFMSYWRFDHCWWHTACSCCSSSTGRLRGFVMFIFEVSLCWWFVHVSKYTHFKFQIFFTLNSGSLLGLCWAVQAHSSSRHFLFDWWQSEMSVSTAIIYVTCLSGCTTFRISDSHTHTHIYACMQVCLDTCLFAYLPT